METQCAESEFYVHVRDFVTGVHVHVEKGRNSGI